MDEKQLKLMFLLHFFSHLLRIYSERRVSSALRHLHKVLPHNLSDTQCATLLVWSAQK